MTSQEVRNRANEAAQGVNDLLFAECFVSAEICESFRRNGITHMSSDYWRNGRVKSGVCEGDENVRYAIQVNFARIDGVLDEQVLAQLVNKAALIVHYSGLKQEPKVINLIKDHRDSSLRDDLDTLDKKLGNVQKARSTFAASGSETDRKAHEEAQGEALKASLGILKNLVARKNGGFVENHPTGYLGRAEALLHRSTTHILEFEVTEADLPKAIKAINCLEQAAGIRKDGCGVCP